MVALDHAVASIHERRIDEAEAAVEAAIDLEPGAPEAYWLRSSIHRQMRRYAEAARDWVTCLALDPHFLEAEKLRLAADRVRHAFLNDPALDAARERLRGVSARSADLAAFLRERARALVERRRGLARPSCSLPCPSQCCYFDEEPFIFIEPSKLEPLRAYLREHGLVEAEHVGRASAAESIERIGEERAARVLCQEDGGPCAYYLRRDDRVMPLAYRGRPRKLDGRALPWLTAVSRACRFASSSGCLLHDLGDPPGLDTCRAFLCLTGFVYYHLTHLGVVSTAELASRSIADLHEQAWRLLPLLDEFYAGEEATGHEAAMRESLVAAIEADAAGNREQASAGIAAYRCRLRLLELYREGQLDVMRKAMGCPGRGGSSDAKLSASGRSRGAS